MIILKNIYGNKIFNRKASYRNARYIPFVADLLLDLILAWALVRIFDVGWDYAFVKVYAILLLYGVFNYIFTSMVDALNYRLAIKNVMAEEMKHYLTVFNRNFNWNEVSTYDDFFLEAAFHDTLPTDLRVLAAINYGAVMEINSLSSKFESRSYRLFSQIAPDYILNDEKLIF